MKYEMLKTINAFMEANPFNDKKLSEIGFKEWGEETIQSIPQYVIRTHNPVALACYTPTGNILIGSGCYDWAEALSLGMTRESLLAYILSHELVHKTLHKYMGYEVSAAYDKIAYLIDREYHMNFWDVQE